MTDKKTKLPKEGVRRFVPNEYVSPHRSFLASTVRNYVSDVEVIVYPAEGSIVDDLRAEVEEASRCANEWFADRERVKAENERLREALEQIQNMTADAGCCPNRDEDGYQCRSCAVAGIASHALNLEMDDG